MRITVRHTYIIITLSLLARVFAVSAASPGQIAGRVVDSRSGEAICGAVAGIEGTYRWAVTDRDGRFSLGTAPASKELKLSVSYLGYVTRSVMLDPHGDLSHLEIRLTENTLAIDEVVVTARRKAEEPSSAYVIERHALDHLQMSNVADVAALLPGGKTVNPDLTSDSRMALRTGGQSIGNAAFGTAVEVDGVRLSDNASFGAMNSVGTRNIAVADIESVEIITGVPSAEYGDVNSGIVKITTRKGRTPWNVQLAANPRTYQASLSKGFDLGDERGTLNVAAEWTRATRKLVSPYTSYSRRSISLAYANTFRGKLRFEAGITGNIGGMKAEDDPDAFSGEWQKDRDNVLRGNAAVTWQLNRSWITNLRFDASASYRDNRSHVHAFNSYASQQPAVHATEEGYFLAGKLPFTYFSDCVVDSREADYAASLKYEWNREWNDIGSRLKAGVQYRATGNEG
ncbi:MAG: carboxypeptidase-like regulatory domain-containing protein, partial [Alistipes sp.]|nr:carboxypeptidase-like regulatory domain-containing protein [Alistipes sp.]